MSQKTGLCYAPSMADTPPESPTDPESGAVVVFAIGPDMEQAAARELVDLCRQHAAIPMVLDATCDPWFADHLKDPRTRQYFPLLCVRGGLVGGLDVVRQLERLGKLGPLLSADPKAGAPRIALSQAAADELRRALTEPSLCVRVVVSSGFEHDLAVDSERPDDIKLTLGDIPVLVDTESASRADGLAIDWIDTGDGHGHAFRMDNPNRPEPVRVVDRAWLEDEGQSINLLIVDVRTKREFTESHLGSARLLDADLIDALELLDRRTPLLFYCNSGVRSHKAAARYRELGFAEVYCLKLG